MGSSKENMDNQEDTTGTLDEEDLQNYSLFDTSRLCQRLQKPGINLIPKERQNPPTHIYKGSGTKIYAFRLSLRRES